MYLKAGDIGIYMFDYQIDINIESCKLIFIDINLSLTSKLETDYSEESIGEQL